MAAESSILNLTLKSPKLKPQKLEILSSEDISVLKKKINSDAYPEIAVENMRVVYGGKILQEGSTLTDWGVSDGKTLIIVNVTPEKKVAVKVPIEKIQPNTNKSTPEQPSTEQPGSETEFNAPSPESPLSQLGDVLTGLVNQVINPESELRGASFALGAAGLSALTGLLSQLPQMGSSEGGEEGGANGTNYLLGMLPVMLAGLSQVRDQLTVENLVSILENENVQAFIESTKSLPANTLQTLNNLYVNNPQIQRFVDSLEDILVGLQQNNSSPQLVGVVAALRSLLDGIRNYSENTTSQMRQAATDATVNLVTNQVLTGGLAAATSWAAAGSSPQMMIAFQVLSAIASSAASASSSRNRSAPSESQPDVIANENVNDDINALD